MDRETLADIIRCCRRLRRLLLLGDTEGLTPQDLVVLVELLRGMYGGGPFDMDLGADDWLLQEASAFAVSKGWCAPVGGIFNGIDLMW